MGAFKKIIFTIMSIFLLALSGLFVTLAFANVTIRDGILSKLDNVNYRYLLAAFAVVLVIFVIILIIDIIIHRNEKADHLVKTELGDIYISRHSLEASVESSINKFDYARLESAYVKIIGEEKIQADVNCYVSRDRAYQNLGKEMQEEVERALKILTGIENVEVNLYLKEDKRQQARQIR